MKQKEAKEVVSIRLKPSTIEMLDEIRGKQSCSRQQLIDRGINHVVRDYLDERRMACVA